MYRTAFRISITALVCSGIAGTLDCHVVRGQGMQTPMPSSASQVPALNSNVLPNPATTGQTNPNGWNRPVSSFIDPRTGIVYDRFIENESVPTTRWEVEEKTERRWVPEMQTETRQVTQVEYIPVMSYETKINNGSAWNPFSSGQPTVQYVPKVDYVPVNRVVNMPVQVQKYVEREIPVRVPKLVQATESRSKYVDRPRSGKRFHLQRQLQAMFCQTTQHNRLQMQPYPMQDRR